MKPTSRKTNNNTWPPRAAFFISMGIQANIKRCELDVMTSSNTLQAAFQQVEKYHPKQIKALVLACPHIDYFKK